MRILMTQRELIGFHGSEMVTVEVAKELADRGHEIIVFSPRIGEVAQLLWPSGVRAVSRLGDVPWIPDLIHGHHHLPTMAALARFEKAPAIYYCHGTKPWVEQPPMHERICNYVMMCEWMVRRTITEFDLEPERVSCVPNFVNTARFSEVREPPRRIKRALLFHGSGFSKAELSRLNTGCVGLGIKFDKIGGAYGSGHTRPEIILQNYDLVFASGKSALEAMATGCAVMTLAAGQAGSLVTTENFEQCSFMNFAPRYFASATQISEAWLRRELTHYSSDDAAQVTQKVRQDRTLNIAVDRLEELYQTTLQSGDVPEEAPFANYLERLASEVDAMWLEREGLRAFHTRMKRQRFRGLLERIKSSYFQER